MNIKDLKKSYNKGKDNPMYDKKHSLNTKEKMRNSQKVSMKSLRKKCIICNNTFQPKTNRANTCSDKCSYKRHKNYGKIYRKLNSQKIIKWITNYNKENKNKINRRLRLYMKNKRKNDEYFAIKERLRANLRYVLRKYGEGKKVSSKKYGIDYEAIIKHLGKCPNTTKYEIDHIVPLSHFDLTDSEQIKLAFAPYNHQWLTKSENLVKGNKIEE